MPASSTFALRASTISNKATRPAAPLSVPGTAVRDPLTSLMARIARKDSTALAELYQHTSARLFGLAVAILRHNPDAEEVLSDVYCQVWRSAARYEPGRGTVLVWLLMLCRSRAIDHYRERRLRSQQMAECHPELEFPLMSGPENLLEGLQQNTQIYRALQSLSPLRQRLLGMAFFRGLTHCQIALATNLPVGSVKSHIRRALHHLGASLAAVKHGVSSCRDLPQPQRCDLCVTTQASPSETG